MVPERRHPIDSYIGYIVFKNGLPVAYAGSWILFDSGRIGLNVFPSYRGGESQYIFEQVLKLHQKVYRLRRFSVDPINWERTMMMVSAQGHFGYTIMQDFVPSEKINDNWPTLKPFKSNRPKTTEPPHPF
jgi:hypothetical protein